MVLCDYTPEPLEGWQCTVTRYHQNQQLWTTTLTLLFCSPALQKGCTLEEAQQSFETLKSAFTSAPILFHWIPNQPLIVETDASNYALYPILSIQNDSGKIHPVTFHSHTSTSPEYFTLPHLFWPDPGGLRPEFHQNPLESAYSGLTPMLAGVSANFAIYSGFSLVSIWSQSFFFTRITRIFLYRSKLEFCIPEILAAIRTETGLKPDFSVTTYIYQKCYKHELNPRPTDH